MAMTPDERVATALFTIALERVIPFLPDPVRFACNRIANGDNSQADDDLFDAWIETADDDE